MLRVIKLNVVMLSVIMLNVIMLSVIMLNIAVLSVVAPEDDAIKNLLTLFAKLDRFIVLSTLFFFFKTDQLAKQIYSKQIYEINLWIIFVFLSCSKFPQS